LLSKLVKNVLKKPDGGAALHKYKAMQETEGWQVHLAMLLYIQGLFAEDMLSPRFTGLKPIEKDVNQRAYAMVNTLIQFLLNPLEIVQAQNAVDQHNIKQWEATFGKRPKKG